MEHARTGRVLASRLPYSRKGTDWLAVLKVFVLYRLADSGSELRMHSCWLAGTAVAELLGNGASRRPESTPPKRHVVETFGQNSKEFTTFPREHGKSG